MSKNSSTSNEKSKRRRYDLRGLRTAAIAFVIMALADFSLHAMRMFFKNSMIELAYIGVITIAWLIMLMGTRKIADYNGDFKRAYGTTIPAIFACLAWLIIAIVELQRGVGKQTFSSLGIMLMGYIVMLCMLYCYAHLLNGSSVVLDGFRKEKLQKSCRRIWKVSMLLIIIAVLCEQGAPLFPEQIKYMITISAAVVSLIVQMLMIKNLLVVYDIVDGKLEPRRLKDVLDGIKEEDAKEAKAEPENNEGKVAKEAVDEDVAPEIADNEEASEEPIEEPDEEATEVLIEEAAAETPDESDEEPQEEEVGESSEELKDEEAEESTEELAGESVEEMGDEKIDEAPDESDEEPQEEELGESPEEQMGETDDESDEEPADGFVDELVEEVQDEQADEPAEESVEEMQDEQAGETIEEMQDEPAEKPTGKLTEDKTIDLREILTVVTAKDNNDNNIEENFEEPEAESVFEAPEELKDEEQSSEDIQFEDEKEEIEKETEEPEDEEPSIDDIRFEDEVTDAGEMEEPEIEAQGILEDEESGSEELKLEDIVFDNEEDDKWKTEELELNEITGQESKEPEETPEQAQPSEPEDDKITALRNRIEEIRIIEKGLSDPIDRLNAAAERIELEKELKKAEEAAAEEESETENDKV